MSTKKYILQDPATGKQLELQSRAGTVGPEVLDIRAL